MIRTTIFSIEIPSFKVALFGTKRSHISSSYPPFTALKFSSCIEIVSTTRVLPLQVFSRGEKNPTSRKVSLRRVKKSWTKAHIYLYIYIYIHAFLNIRWRNNNFAARRCNNKLHSPRRRLTLVTRRRVQSSVERISHTLSWSEGAAPPHASIIRGGTRDYGIRGFERENVGINAMTPLPGSCPHKSCIRPKRGRGISHECSISTRCRLVKSTKWHTPEILSSPARARVGQARYNKLRRESKTRTSPPPSASPLLSMFSLHF